MNLTLTSSRVPGAASGWICRLALGGLLASLSILGPISCKPRAAGDVVLAEVGAQRITAADLRLEVERRAAARKPVPDKETLLQELVTRAALLERARMAGIPDEAGVRREVENLVISHWQERELGKRLTALTVSDAEIQEDYTKNLAQHTRSAQARFAWLSVKAEAKTHSAERRAEQRERLNAALRQFRPSPSDGQRAPEDRGFGSVSAQISDDQSSRYRGGDLGWLETGRGPSRVPAEVLEAAWKLSVGESSSVIETPDGYFAIMKTDERPAKVTPLDDLRASLRQTLLARKRHEAEEAFRKEAVVATAARTHAEALASVELPHREKLMARKDDPEPPPLPGGTTAFHGH
ncbi:MAG: peptidyl-prolyl cis-trans isomerase [Verrucomicrobiales bacterium]|nr:peptidyl-prolyl cis-trans isomerase [Verrucomicrobiales bacterium]